MQIILESLDDLLCHQVTLRTAKYNFCETKCNSVTEFLLIYGLKHSNQ